MKRKKELLLLHYGCKVNQYETNAMAQKLLQEGYEIVEQQEKADIYIINTCTVTNMSDRKSRQMLRRMKQRNKEAIIVAVGCYAQVAKEELEKMDEIDLVLGNQEKAQIVEILKEKQEQKKKNVVVEDVMQVKEFSDFGTITFTETTRAVIKVQDGCDRFCSYCIIPYARGRVRSRKPQSILTEIQKIVEKGIQEVVITGIHIASYGKDFKEDYGLIDLLEEINQIQGLKRIRLGSIEPLWITKEVVARLKKLDKLCPHFHLSLQSGCNQTLKRMNRRYTIEQFREIVQILRQAFSECILTTDIIVGFPGETQEEFDRTYQFLKEIHFYKMHVFPYSPRKGTKASQMPEQVLPSVKEQRSKKLLALSNENQIQYHKDLIGRELEVLWEEEKHGFYQGHTKNYILVTKQTEEKLENTISKVVVKSADIESVLVK